ncbi:NicO-domain-containing protein [Pseudovirgaria hyperparasitica]|uniref:Nickel/cobalt efflux system n=1 Tax=Pseudovirgaria hyperparasitica TaxID=470096 RepID=A0A6A6WML9_9PEZI|nr:NicO-domain-containing protein [Pseudovirgaria hyperparasitica]KAF2763376.1 NicO-domain-containing protein [Pseudovirgaria hyperparasitica]
MATTDISVAPLHEEPDTLEHPNERQTLLKSFSDKAAVYHDRVPYLRKLPFNALAIILFIAFVNAVVWVAVGIVLHFNAGLASTAVLAYTLGLRHALDADHISAIDLMTRRLIASGQRPVTVGMFFSLGHSTIVIVTSIVVAATAAAISSRFDNFTRVGNIIGTSVSAAFLLLLGAMNVWILVRLRRRLIALIYPSSTTTSSSTTSPNNPDAKPLTAGLLFTLFHRLFKLIDQPWKMYPLGILFGLGFDTSSEVALLGISSIQAAAGTSIWLILIFPLLFTAGMCLLDTADGAAMMSVYTSSALARDAIAVLYYSIVLTLVTVVVALVIGVIQVLSLVANVAEPEGGFWDGVAVAGEYYDVIGGAICGSFIVFGVLSVLLYKPWRRHIDRKMLLHQRRLDASRDDDNPNNNNDDDDAVNEAPGQAADSKTKSRVHVTQDEDGEGAGVGGSVRGVV